MGACQSDETENTAGAWGESPEFTGENHVEVRVTI